MAQLEKPYRRKVPEPDNTKIQIILVKGDLTRIKADAVVFPANSNKNMGQDLVNQALWTAANSGPGIDMLIYELEEKKLEVGGAVVTRSYALDSDIAVHAVAPTYEEGSDECNNLLAQAYENALLQADVHNAETIAFPLLGSGESFGYPDLTAIEIALTTLLNPNGLMFKNIHTAFLFVNEDQVYELMSEMYREMTKHVKKFNIPERKSPSPGPADDFASSFPDPQSMF